MRIELLLIICVCAFIPLANANTLEKNKIGYWIKDNIIIEATLLDERDNEVEIGYLEPVETDSSYWDLRDGKVIWIPKKEFYQFKDNQATEFEVIYKSYLDELGGKPEVRITIEEIK